MNKYIKDRLDFYNSIQPIEVVYRPNERVTWGRNRKFYDGICDLDYNHRTILDCEVVFDFDSDKIEENIENSFEVIEKLCGDDISFTVWHTGSKGIHIHTHWKGLNHFKDLSLMKKTIMKHYAYGKNIDYQLAGKHLVRMEFGINEKHRDSYKTSLAEDTTFWFNDISGELIREYQEELNKYLERRLTTPANVDDQLIKDFLDGKYLLNDGREKFMFFLINMLKYKIPEEELVSRIHSWYTYAGGTKLTFQEIKRKVRYHIQRNVTYPFNESFFKSLMKTYNVQKRESTDS